MDNNNIQQQKSTIPGDKRQLKAQDVTAKYCIYDIKYVPSLPMSFFVRIKGCVLYDDLSTYKTRIHALNRLNVTGLEGFRQIGALLLFSNS